MMAKPKTLDLLEIDQAWMESFFDNHKIPKSMREPGIERELAAWCVSVGRKIERHLRGEEKRPSPMKPRPARGPSPRAGFQPVLRSGKDPASAATPPQDDDRDVMHVSDAGFGLSMKMDEWRSDPNHRAWWMLMWFVRSGFQLWALASALRYPRVRHPLLDKVAKNYPDSSRWLPKSPRKKGMRGKKLDLEGFIGVGTEILSGPGGLSEEDALGHTGEFLTVIGIGSAVPKGTPPSKEWDWNLDTLKTRYQEYRKQVKSGLRQEFHVTDVFAH